MPRPPGKECGEAKMTEPLGEWRYCNVSEPEPISRQPATGERRIDIADQAPEGVDRRCDNRFVNWCPDRLSECVGSNWVRMACQSLSKFRRIEAAKQRPVDSRKQIPRMAGCASKSKAANYLSACWWERRGIG